MKIPFLDLRVINEEYREDLISAANKVIDSGWYVKGERVKIFEDVFVAVENVDKWTRLKSSDFQLMEKEVTSIRGNVVESIGEIIGKRADRFIKKGDVLTSEAIEEMPVVFPEDKLDACSIVGNVKVSFFVFAKQEGTIGDVIRVRTNENKIYKAKVIDYKNVLIIE